MDPARLGVVLALAMLAAPPAAPAVTVPELICQQSTGKESLRFLKRAHKAERLCADAPTRGRICDTGRRDETLTGALTKLGRTLTGRCDGIALESLGFPAACLDPGGAPFTTGELVACLDVSHRAGIDTAIATAYPEAPGPLDRRAGSCQRKIGSAGERFLLKRLRARQSCLNDQLSGRLDSGVDCRADVPPAGPGTGHAKTDRRLATAPGRLARVLARACGEVALAELGFPGACDDPDGGLFTVEDLRACLIAGHALVADTLLAIEYPAP